MAFDFPNAPTVGQVFAPVGGTYYVWDGQKWAMTTQALVQTLTQTADARNRIVNPAMQHSQENGTTSGTVNGYYAADQWLLQLGGIAGVSLARFAATAGASACLALGFSTAKPSLAAGDFASHETKIEGVRMADFGWGTPGALPIVIRFEANVGVAGTFSVAIRNSATNRSYLKTFVLPAGAWTTVALTVPGDTTGTWLIDNGVGMTLDFTFACGSTFLGAAGWQAGNLLGVTGMSNGAASLQSCFIRNVGLYLDPSNTGAAPPWVTPDFASELEACKRYWFKWPYYIILNGYGAAGQAVYGSFPFPVTMRAVPTITLPSPGYSNASAFTTNNITTDAVTLQMNLTAAGMGYALGQVNANARM